MHATGVQGQACKHRLLKQEVCPCGSKTARYTHSGVLLPQLQNCFMSEQFVSRLQTDLSTHTNARIPYIMDFWIIRAQTKIYRTSYIKKVHQKTLHKKQKKKTIATFRQRNQRCSISQMFRMSQNRESSGFTNIKSPLFYPY